MAAMAAEREHLRNKTGPSSNSASNAVSSSAATLPSYFMQQQRAPSPSTAMPPPRLANGRVGYKAASSEDYGTGEKEGLLQKGRG